MAERAGCSTEQNRVSGFDIFQILHRWFFEPEVTESVRKGQLFVFFLSVFFRFLTGEYRIFFIQTGGHIMPDGDGKRIALAGIIVEKTEAAEDVNRILHDFSEWVVGRMGIPYRSRGVSIISIVLDAPQHVLSALSGKLGMLDGVSVKTVCSKNLKGETDL